MRKVYELNGLPFWSAEEINRRKHFTDQLSLAVSNILVAQNRGWVFEQVEAPCLIPASLVSSEYNATDYYQVGELSLRPETTAASYEYAKGRVESQSIAPPFCIWQLAKSFRNENDQVSKNMRFKEFYQLEFQCIFTVDTKNDYHEAVLEQLRSAVHSLTGLAARVVPSDRLPSYSQKTTDIEVKTSHKWLEVCSVSLRNDVPFKWNERQLLNLEIAFGMDRLVEAFNKWRES